MYCITLDSHDPFFNLAIEELLLKTSKQEYLILGINSPAVIVGKHQSPHREINTKFVSENDIPVIRRISGGGTVFHDWGNVNYTFIRQSEEGKQVDFRKYTQPVIDFLLLSGVNAKFEGKNDIKVHGSKISGNAEHVHRNRVLHHGTLLYNSSLDLLRNSLRKDPSNYTSRAVESNPSSVVNLISILKNFNDIYDFRSSMMHYFIDTLPDMLPYQLTRTETEEAEALAHSKYSTWEWNWAYGPEYNFSNRFNVGEVIHSCSIFVKDGIIRECKIEGSDKMSKIGETLIGCRHMVSDIKIALVKENLSLQDINVFNFF